MATSRWTTRTRTSRCSDSAGGSGHCQGERFCGMTRSACTEGAPRGPCCGQGATPLPARSHIPLRLPQSLSFFCSLPLCVLSLLPIGNLVRGVCCACVCVCVCEVCACMRGRFNVDIDMGLKESQHASAKTAVKHARRDWLGRRACLAGGRRIPRRQNCGPRPRYGR